MISEQLTSLNQAMEMWHFLSCRTNVYLLRLRRKTVYEEGLYNVYYMVEALEIYTDASGERRVEKCGRWDNPSDTGWYTVIEKQINRV